jgi:formate-dependent nitrite reductase cytochrome c552 subunit
LKEVPWSKGIPCYDDLDFVVAENSTGFYTPQESARIPGESMNFLRLGQFSLRELK